MIVERDCHGLKTSAARVSKESRDMGFRASKADFDLWMRPKDDHCECAATQVDDIMVFSKDCMSMINRIKEVFDLNGVGIPKHHLGGIFGTIDEREPANAFEVGNGNPQQHLSPK